MMTPTGAKILADARRTLEEIYALMMPEPRPVPMPIMPLYLVVPVTTCDGRITQGR